MICHFLRLFHELWSNHDALGFLRRGPRVYDGQSCSTSKGNHPSDKTPRVVRRRDDPLRAEPPMSLEYTVLVCQPVSKNRM